MTRIIIADDHRLLREGLKMALRTRPNFLVVGEAADGLELVGLLNQGVSADLLIVDLAMPRLGGIEAIRSIRKTDPDVKVLVLTMHREEELFCQAFLAGADGYLLKEDMGRELFKAIEIVMEGKVYVSPYLAKGLEDTWLKVFIATKGSPGRERLSTEEMTVLRLLVARESHGEIARKMSIPSAAVVHHREEILRKLEIEEFANHP